MDKGSTQYLVFIPYMTVIQIDAYTAVRILQCNQASIVFSPVSPPVSINHYKIIIDFCIKLGGTHSITYLNIIY